MSLRDSVGTDGGRDVPAARGSWMVTALGAVIALALLALALLPAAGDALPRDRSKPRIVVDSGRAPDGTQYRHVVYGGALDYSVDGKPISFRGWCKGLEWPDRPRRGGSVFCEEHGGGPSVDSPVDGVGYRFVQYGLAGEDVAKPDVVVSGQTSARAADVRVFYTDASGRESELAVDFARLAGSRLKAAARRLTRAAKRMSARNGEPRSERPRKSASVHASRPRPYGVFTAFVAGEQAAGGRLAARALAGDGDPQLGHPLSTGDLGGLLNDGSHCDSHDGPFRVVAYDSDGRELARPGRC